MYLLYKSIELIASFMPFLLFSYLADSILDKSDHYRKRNFLFFGFLYLTIVIGVAAFVHNLMISVLAMFLCVTMVYIQYDTGIYLNMIFVILFNIADILITNLVITLFGFIDQYDTDLLFMEGNPVRALYVLTITALQMFLVYNLKLFLRKETAFYSKTLFLSALFFIPDFMVVFFLHIVLAYYSSADQVFYLLCLILSLFTFFTSTIGLYLLNLQQREQERLLHQSILEIQLKEQEKQLTETEERFEEFHIYRHDMKHLLLNYSLLLKEGKSEEVQADIRKMLHEPAGFHDHQFTDHRQLNALIHSKYQHCLDHSIDFQSIIRISPFFSDMDLMILLSNALDNAIEAELKEANEDRLIRFELVEKPEHISIILQNRIANSVLKDNPSLKTSKSNPHIHGIGLKSIRSIINKHNGLIDIFEENHFFCLHIIYPNA